MPNHVITEIVFRDVDETRQAEILALATKDGLVDFSVLLPLPLNIWWGSVGHKHSIFPGNALEWCTQSWGTKWNAYDHGETVRTDDSLTLVFQSAWSPPRGWLVALWNKLGLPFSYTFLDEGAIVAKAGYFKPISEGDWFSDQWAEDDCDNTEHRRMHKLMWGVEEFEDEE